MLIAYADSTVGAKSKTPEDLGGAWPVGMGNHAVQTEKDIVTTHAPPKTSGVPLFAAGCQTDAQMIMRKNRLCNPWQLSSEQIHSA
jgi:hypothetical protein